MSPFFIVALIGFAMYFSKWSFLGIAFFANIVTAEFTKASVVTFERRYETRLTLQCFL